MKWFYTEKVLNKYIDKMNQEMGAKLQDYDIAKSTSFYLVVNGMTYEVTFKTLDYFKYIESGRKAGSKMPPIDAISAWIERKHITPHATKDGKLPTKQQLSYVIARSIAENGIPPKPYLQETITSTVASQSFNDELSDAIADDISFELAEWLQPTFGVI